MGLINSKIFPDKGARVRVTDLGDAFPERQIGVDSYDMDDKGQVDKLWADMAEALEELKTKAAFDKSPTHPMTRLLRARQKLELLKVPTLISLSQDALAQGYSVAIFVSFTQTLEELEKRLGSKCRIDGSQVGETGIKDRRASIEAFQANREKIIICNVDAGGVSVSLHDEMGGHPRIGFVSPGWSAVKLRQVFGRLHRAGAKSKALYRVVFSAGTVEDRICSSLRGKLNRMDALQDGDLMADNLR